MQAEVLAKLQRGGEQVVKVVHVHPGAQAIVGNVVQAQGGNGEGGANESWNKPHAKGELPTGDFQPMPEVWSEDTERQPMPVTVCQR